MVLKRSNLRKTKRTESYSSSKFKKLNELRTKVHQFGKN